MGSAFLTWVAEGKNAAYLAESGAFVDAVDLSQRAIRNGLATWHEKSVRWMVADVLNLPYPPSTYDVVICYGLFHCFASAEQVEQLLELVDRTTRSGASVVVCTFNDRHQELSHADPGFSPLLLPHAWYVDHCESKWRLIRCEDGTITESHPHNGIVHQHSVTRILAEKKL